MVPTTRSDEALDGSSVMGERPPWMVAVVLLGIGVLVIVAYGISVKSGVFLLVELMLATAATVAGGFLGFLFGIPRPGQSRAEGSVENASGVSDYQPSTNLEQVADWLTKILVGVGLVELTKVRGLLGEFGSQIRKTFTESGTEIVSQAVVIAFLAIGFIASFLWTRVYYGAIQVGADARIRDLLSTRLNALERTAKRAENIGTAIATGKLMPGSIGPSSPPGSRAFSPPGSRAEDSILAGLPADVRRKVEKLEAWDKFDWDSDPVSTLFPSAPSEGNGRRLEAEIVSTFGKALVITVRVASVGGNPLSDPVIYLLHPTFPDSVEIIDPVDGIAENKIISEGEFTVGAIADNGNTILSLSLRTLKGAPKWFLDG